MALDEEGIERGGFAVHFDDFKRKLRREKDIQAKKLMTTYPGTDDYEAYMALFLSEDNNSIEICIEDDNRTTTFYIIVPHTESDIFKAPETETANAQVE
jgi:hypothetical protein